MKTYHKDRGWLVEFVGHPTRKKSFYLRLPCEPHDGPQDAINRLPRALYMTGTRDRYALRPKMKKATKATKKKPAAPAGRATATLDRVSYNAWEYVYEGKTHEAQIPPSTALA